MRISKWLKRGDTMTDSKPRDQFKLEASGDAREQFEDDNYYASNYSPLDKRGGGNMFASLLRQYGVFIGIIILGLLALIFIFNWLPRAPEDYQTERLVALEARLGQIEERLSGLERQFEPMDKAGASTGTGPEALRSRVDSLEKATTQRMDALAKRVDALTEKVAALAKKPVAGKSSAVKKASKPQTTPRPKKASYHTVKKGETLYSISRRYGLSVEALLKLNNLGTSTTINPGDKLRVSR
jgi:LysM repeat protein